MLAMLMFCHVHYSQTSAKRTAQRAPPNIADMTLQVQALVAEHKLGAAGRKLGMAMQKELVNTPERLAKVKPPASSSWAAIHKGKQKSCSAKQVEKQTAPSLSQPREDISEAAPALSQAAPADSVPEEAAEPAVTPPSESEDEASDAVLVLGLVKEATVHFSIPETVEDSSEVSLQSCWTVTDHHSSGLLLNSDQATSTVRHRRV